MIQAGIVGVTGYTGHELAIILSRHPGVSLLFATSQSQAGKTLDDAIAEARRVIATATKAQ